MYHIRQFEVLKLLKLQGEPIDIFVSHEWPTAATACTDTT